MSFRQFGGLQFASKHNAVASYYNTSSNLIVTQNVGQPNSYINFLSDISGNISIYGDLDISGNLHVSGVITNTATQPVSTDSSTKVPTTAWVQSAITAGGSNTLTDVLIAGNNAGSQPINMNNQNISAVNTLSFASTSQTAAYTGATPGTYTNTNMTIDANGKISAIASGSAGTIPIGGIILWSGSVASIPSNWSLCNGINNTPNLMDRFIIGAGSTYSVGTTGGSSTVTLTTNELPSHTHNITVRYINTSVSGGGDSRVTSVGGAPSNIDPAVTGTSNSTGAGNAFYILPPYYALCYIIRTA
jgi:hypothetical protein